MSIGLSSLKEPNRSYYRHFQNLALALLMRHIPEKGIYSFRAPLR